jgi:hypothetical protein
MNSAPEKLAVEIIRIPQFSPYPEPDHKINENSSKVSVAAHPGVSGEKVAARRSNAASYRVVRSSASFVSDRIPRGRDTINSALGHKDAPKEDPRWIENN